MYLSVPPLEGPFPQRRQVRRHGLRQPNAHRGSAVDGVLS